MTSSNNECLCCKALWIEFKLTQDLTCAMDKATATIVDFWQGEATIGESVIVYNQLEEGTAGQYVFSGKTNDKGIACYDDIEDKYRIVVLTKCHQEIEFITKLQLVNTVTGSGSGAPICKLQYKTRTICVISCSDESDWKDLAEFQEQEVLADWFTEGVQIKGMAAKVYVPCKSNEYQVLLEEGIDCEPGSGSGSG